MVWEARLAPLEMLERPVTQELKASQAMLVTQAPSVSVDREEQEATPVLRVTQGTSVHPETLAIQEHQA